MNKLSIENPRVPGSIPGRGTTYQEALIRNGQGFFAANPKSLL